MLSLYFICLNIISAEEFFNVLLDLWRKKCNVCSLRSTSGSTPVDLVDDKPAGRIVHDIPLSAETLKT